MSINFATLAVPHQQLNIMFHLQLITPQFGSPIIPLPPSPSLCRQTPPFSTICQHRQILHGSPPPDLHHRCQPPTSNLLVHDDNENFSPSSDLDLLRPPTTKMVTTATSLFRSEGPRIWHPNGSQICDLEVKRLKSGGHSFAFSATNHQILRLESEGPSNLAAKFCDLELKALQIWRPLFTRPDLQLKVKALESGGHSSTFSLFRHQPPRLGVLLYGPPRTGKTLLARAIARNIDANFLKVVSSAIIDKYIGESARLIREMFGYAREHQPCIIFMDEIDAIGGRHFSEGTSADGEIQRTLMELLNHLDGFDHLGKPIIPPQSNSEIRKFNINR
ncbi:Adenosinetriphosphatase [Forsythia ovata]|uniref:Adenosinetriphosphatase n=1 Tax=Forsythia ovata TaxID=205694 RepID=A0ABD1T8N2_9LAMI